MKLDYKKLDDTALALGCKLLCSESMARHTTFKIGGPADRLISVNTQAQLISLLKVIKAEGIPFFLLGNGSNLLVSDKGIRGAVLNLDGDFKKIMLTDDCTVLAGSAVTLASLCTFARDNGLSGLEFAWGIPGTVGGAAYMDAGAYGGEMRDVVTKVCHVTEDGEKCECHAPELEFDYRKSRYTGTKDIITFVECKLSHADDAQISAKMEELMQRRRDKQPYDMPSAGSIFKRPKDGFAAALIEECGLKGRSVGGAQVSEKHSGFIVNTGGASCADVLELIEIIRDTVREQKGISLECEVRVTGE